MKIIGFTIVGIVLFFAWVISYAIKMSKEAYPTAYVKKTTSTNSYKERIEGDWEGGLPLPEKTKDAAKTKKPSTLNNKEFESDSLHDLSNGFDGESFDFDPI